MSVISTILQNKYIYFCTNTSDEFMCTEYVTSIRIALVHTVLVLRTLCIVEEPGSGLFTFFPNEFRHGLELGNGHPCM